jgi:hypothetical protein
MPSIATVAQTLRSAFTGASERPVAQSLRAMPGMSKAFDFLGGREVGMFRGPSASLRAVAEKSLTQSAQPTALRTDGGAMHHMHVMRDFDAMPKQSNLLDGAMHHGAQLSDPAGLHALPKGFGGAGNLASVMRDVVAAGPRGPESWGPVISHFPRPIGSMRMSVAAAADAVERAAANPAQQMPSGGAAAFLAAADAAIHAGAHAAAPSGIAAIAAETAKK